MAQSPNHGTPPNQWAEFKSTLKHLVLESSDFIIGIDKDGDLDWETTATYDAQTPKCSNRRNAVMNAANRLEHSITDFGSERVRLNFKCLIGEALVRTFEDDYENGESKLKEAERFIVARSQEQARRWQLSSAGKMLLLCALGYIIMWLFRPEIIAFIGFGAFYTTLATLAGAFGAMLSIITRIGKLQIDSNAGKELHECEAKYRIIAGMISGCISALAVYSGLLMPIFGATGKLHVGMILSGFSAGLIERFAPSILSQASSTERKPDP